MVIAVSLLAVALVAAAGNRGDLLLIAAGVCAAVEIFGLLAFGSASRRDRLDHHEREHLLDEYFTPPSKAPTRDEDDESPR